MDIYMKVKLTIGLLYFLQTLTCIKGQYTYNYVGCYKDRQDRALSGERYENNENSTIETCVEFCGKRGYTYAGLQDGMHCFCGNSGYAKYGEGDGCTYPCAGNSNQMCGGVMQNSVFQISEAREEGLTTTHSSATSPLDSGEATEGLTATHSSATSPLDSEGANGGSQKRLHLALGLGVPLGITVIALVILIPITISQRRRSKAELAESKSQNLELENGKSEAERQICLEIERRQCAERQLEAQVEAQRERTQRERTQRERTQREKRENAERRVALSGQHEAQSAPSVSYTQNIDNSVRNCSMQ